jgi:penicillin-binding protein 1A
MMNAMLADTLRIGTGRRAELPGWPAAGKTGTSQDYRDAWFIGYTAPLVCGVWLGNDDGTPSKRATGGSLPAAIWSRFMTEALKGVPVAALPGGVGVTVAASQPATGESYEDQPWGPRQQPRRPQPRDQNFFRIDAGFLKRLFGG